MVFCKEEGSSGEEVLLYAIDGIYSKETTVKKNSLVINVSLLKYRDMN